MDKNELASTSINQHFTYGAFHSLLGIVSVALGTKGLYTS